RGVGISKPISCRRRPPPHERPVARQLLLANLHLRLHTNKRTIEVVHMPLVRIDLNRSAPAERIRIASEAVYKAMIDVANVPVHDKFQVVTRHETDEIVYPQEGYLGTQYSPDLIIIQVTWVAGRSVEVKKRFFRSIADEIHERAK